MRIAVILESPLYSGGGFQQELSTAVLLNRHPDGYEFVFYVTRRENIAILKDQGIQARYLETGSFVHKVHAGLVRNAGTGQLLCSLGMGRLAFEKVLIRDGIDLVYFLSPSWLALLLSRLNYVITIWDQCHRDHPEFPEVRLNKEFEKREYFYRNALFKAVAVIADSEHGRADLVRRYGCDASRVYAAPFLPPDRIDGLAETDVIGKYSIGNKFIFYPAQFWSHKNHIYILDGLKILREKYGFGLDVVFSGSDKGNLNHVLRYARSLGLQGSVHCVGFVPHCVLISLYRKAVALVMPTYFGPTNIPPLEAFSLGCPVCYPDLPGLRDQVADAAFLMDLADPASLATHLVTILNDKDLVQKKIMAGKSIVSRWLPKDYWKVLNGIFVDYAVKMRCFQKL
jgi:glycosyltransferase involved in cell wall biosynthesis